MSEEKNQNIVEYARKLAINQLFEMDGFSNCWETWGPFIVSNFINGDAPTSYQLLHLGDHLREVFRTTGQAGRSQSDVSSGGANWEALVCWYLNLCLIGRRTVVIKHHKKLLPDPIQNGITVKYGSTPSNTESDLVAITFPDKEEYSKDKNDIEVFDENGEQVDLYNNRGKYQFIPVMNALTMRDFSELEVHIIQCKTNWNDNAQIPMLWDAVYSATSFANNITVGSNGFTIHDLQRFTYSFVTVPSNRLEKSGKPTYKENSTAVLRVRNLSGGNYWGLQSKEGVADSVMELINKNLKTGESKSVMNSIQDALPFLMEKYEYFKLM